MPPTSSAGMNRNRLRTKKSLLVGDCTERNNAVSGVSRLTSARAAPLASSGVGACTTATMSSVPWVNAAS